MSRFRVSREFRLQIRTWPSFSNATFLPKKDVAASWGEQVLVCRRVELPMEVLATFAREALAILQTMQLSSVSY
jgi:hypothetical protein